jgi:hypothetical protein
VENALKTGNFFEKSDKIPLLCLLRLCGFSFFRLFYLLRLCGWFFLPSVLPVLALPLRA